MTRIAGVIGLVLLGLLIATLGGWGILALYFAGPKNEALRTVLAGGFGTASLAVLVALFSSRWRWRACANYLVLVALTLVWYFSLEPSNDRDWQADVAVLPYATIEGDFVTVHNIRNVEYRSETDYTPAWYDRRFDLTKLTGVDLIAVYWMGPTIAHIFVSFEFDGNEHLAISVETRKKKGDSYSTVKGFFRQYELAYIVADERDLIRLRTNFRHDPPEQVFVYRTNSTNDNNRRFFLEYMHNINQLKTTPEFYNSLTSNCTSTIGMNSRVNDDHLPLSWQILATGYVPDYLYEHARLANGSLPFAELKSRAYVNERAHNLVSIENFSHDIRNPDLVEKK